MRMLRFRIRTMLVAVAIAAVLIRLLTEYPDLLVLAGLVFWIFAPLVLAPYLMRDDDTYLRTLTKDQNPATFPDVLIDSETRAPE